MGRYETGETMGMDDKMCASQPYTWGEFMMLMLGFASVAMLVFAIQGWNECGGIPSLPVYCVVFFAVNFSSNLLKFVFRLDKPGGLHNEDTDPVKIVNNLLSLGLLGTAIWGAVVSWKYIKCFGSC